ncbi:hypothetical protein R1flu_028229 [Riccia fluitans]|uniref:Uncharacterized protein n=1 Tax=Riccia fluitans TaxID=41844 RepID=A0ABD1XP22_9MARC
MISCGTLSSRCFQRSVTLLVCTFEAMHCQCNLAIVGPAEVTPPPIGLPQEVLGSHQAYPMRIIGSPEASVQFAASISDLAPFVHPASHPMPLLPSVQQRLQFKSENDNTAGDRKV